MMCQSATNAVTYMFLALRYSCTNYIDDFSGAETPDKSTTAFNALGDLFSSPGLQSSPDKDCPLTTSMVFLGIHLDTLAMSMSVTPECLQELLHCCSSALSPLSISCHELQSLCVMSFIMACVHPARIFMSTLLNTLCTHRDSCHCFFLMTIGQASTGGATSSHSTMVHLSSRRRLG